MCLFNAQSTQHPIAKAGCEPPRIFLLDFEYCLYDGVFNPFNLYLKRVEPHARTAATQTHRLAGVIEGLLQRL